MIMKLHLCWYVTRPCARHTTNNWIASAYFTKDISSEFSSPCNDESPRYE